MSHRLILVMLFVALCAGPSAADSLAPLDAKWSRYVNQRFGTVLHVPRGFTPVEPPPESGDGREFRAADGAKLLVYGSYAADAVMIDFEDYKRGLVIQAQSDGLDLKYDKAGKGWLVYSGIKGETIVYAKVIEGCGAAHELVIEYPVAKKAVYDPVVTRLSSSLTCHLSAKR